MRGHIRRRGTNSWELKFDIDRADGQRQIRYKSFKGTRREAQNELARLLAAVADGAHVDPSQLTVGEHVRARFVHWQETGEITPSTTQRYCQLIDHHIIPHLGNKLVQKLSTLDIERWHITLKNRGRLDGQGGLHPRTIGHAHRLLGKALNEAQRHGLVVKNVGKLQGAPKVPAKEMRILTPEGVADLPALVHGHALGVPALTALYAGMREAEILALPLGNLDLDGKIIKVRVTLEETKEGGLRIKPPKTEAGIRDITLPSILVEILRTHRKQLLERRILFGLGKPSDEDFVFPRWDGSPQSPSSFSAMWNKLAKQLGIEVSFHGLRHTHASILIDQGVDVVTIAKRLGHASPAITLQVYAHLFRKDDGKAAAAIDKALGK
jgi:integrase